MNPRTFSRAQWDEAQQLWTDFNDEWRPFRHEAAMRGMLYPPAGSRGDSWDDDPPSQRAILIRAIRDTPQLLHRLIAESRSWSEVVDKLIRQIDDWRADATRREAWDREHDEQADHETSVRSIAHILDRIEDAR